jgi:hypothetical protein
MKGEWRPSRFRLARRTYDAPPWGCIVRVDGLTKSRKPHTPGFWFHCHPQCPWHVQCGGGKPVVCAWPTLRRASSQQQRQEKVKDRLCGETAHFYPAFCAVLGTRVSPTRTRAARRRRPSPTRASPGAAVRRCTAGRFSRALTGLGRHLGSVSPRPPGRHAQQYGTTKGQGLFSSREGFRQPICTYRGPAWGCVVRAGGQTEPDWPPLTDCRTGIFQS